MNIFAFGSSIVSSYWNGSGTYYRGVYKGLHRLGHTVTFAEPDAYGRQQHRDDGDYSYVNSIVYTPAKDIDAMLALARDADVVVKHSGIGVDDEELERRVLECQPKAVVVFWDVDAPATLARLDANSEDPFREAVGRYNAILTYGGGPAVERGYKCYGARGYASIYNGLDPETHYPVPPNETYMCDLAFLGNRLPDRERRVEELFLRAAELAPEKRFLFGGEGWADKPMPPNVRWIGHVPTTAHNTFNCSAGMVLNVNRASMAQSGFSPPTRVFEVAGSGSCLLCDDWPGIEDCFAPGKELLVVRNAEDVVEMLHTHDAESRTAIGRAFLKRALHDHTYTQRAALAEKALHACLRENANSLQEHSA